jgi:hypothetical protein
MTEAIERPFVMIRFPESEGWLERGIMVPEADFGAATPLTSLRRFRVGCGLPEMIPSNLGGTIGVASTAVSTGAAVGTV